jgi:hypothetical protein
VYLNPNFKRKGRTMKNITAVLLTALLVLTVSLNLACQKQKTQPGSASGGSGAGGAGTEIQGAQQLLDKIRASNSFEQLPDLLTNRTAAGLAFPLIIFAQLGMAFSSAGPQAGAEGNENHAGPDEKTKQMQAELDTILKRYGIDEQTMSDDSNRKAVSAQIESRGRELLTDLVAFMKKVSPDKEPEKNPPLPPNDTLNFERLSPTAVKVSSKDGKSLSGFDKDSFEARLEDGKWRMDAGGIEEMMQGMKKSMEGGPGNGNKNSNK